MSASLDPRVGTEIAGYRVERLLGRGGMSVVYLAEQVRLKRRAALKLLAPELADDERFRERFLRESELAASLDHPSVIPIYDAGETDGVLYIAMRYVEGSDLRELLREKCSLEPERALQILRPVAEALDYAHAHGLVHRDVKPGNILLASDGPVYLSDFGLTRRVDEGASLTEAGELVGSIDYAAPEQIDGRPVDGRADVYSLACVTYECLTGTVPYPRDSPMAKLWAHLRDTPLPAAAINPDLPPELDPVLQRGLAKNPDERYQTASALLDSLQNAVAPAGPTAGRRSRRTLVLGMLAVLAAITAVTAALVLTLGESATAEPVLPLTGDSVVRIDPATGEVTAALPVANPGAVAAGLGSIWVVDTRDIALVQIDPETGEHTRTVQLDESRAPGRVAVAGGRVWLLVLGWSGTVYNRWLWTVDPETGKATRVPRRMAPVDMAVRGETVWVIDARGSNDTGKLLKVLSDGSSVTQTARISEVSAFDTRIGTGEAGLWVRTVLEQQAPTGQWQQLLKIDPASGTVARRLDLEYGYLAQFAVGTSSLWVVDSPNDEIAEIDPTTGEVLNRVRVGRIPSVVAVTGDAVWVANTRDGTVSRIDSETLDVQTTDVGGTPQALAATADGVWVSVRVD